MRKNRELEMGEFILKFVVSKDPPKKVATDEKPEKREEAKYV